MDVSDRRGDVPPTRSDLCEIAEYPSDIVLMRRGGYAGITSSFDDSIASGVPLDGSMPHRAGVKRVWDKVEDVGCEAADFEVRILSQPTTPQSFGNANAAEV